MSSKVDICNLALIEARYDETIESLDERSVAAERCKRLYDVCRKEVLCSYPWSFATKFKELARVGEDVDGYKCAYAYPGDCLRIAALYKDRRDYQQKSLRVNAPNNIRVGYLNAAKVVFSNEDAPFAEYIVDEDVEDNFPQTFIRLLYLEISMRLAKLAGVETDDLKLLASQVSDAQSQARMQSVGEDDNHLNVEDNHYINARG